MTFKTKKIRRRAPLKPFKKIKHFVASLAGLLKTLPPTSKNYFIAGILLIFGIFVVLKVTAIAYNTVSNFSPKKLIMKVGSDLKKDEHGYTNIVLLGDGGHKRDGADLIDTIMVASIDYEKNSISLLSIPRDFYIYPNKELGIIYGGRINELYRNHKNILKDEDSRFQLFKKEAGNIVNLDIQYYLRVDFNAFVEVVDSLGGVTVDVKKKIYDPYYPNATDNGHVLFTVDKGIQEMDGEKALKFVRSRKTTSDFDRAARQQQVIEAIQEKALSKDVLGSAGKLKNLYYAVENNINTDMTLREMISLAGFAQGLDHSHIVQKVIHDDPGQEGGFLYTPERELYNGQFVLVPFGGNNDLIHKYSDLIFNQREVYYNQARIDLLNATKLSGIARNAAYQLNRFGFNIEEIDNYRDSNGEKEYLKESVIEYHDYTEDETGLIKAKYQSTLNALDAFVKGRKTASSSYLTTKEEGKKVYEGGKYNISIILGEDYDVFLVN